MSKTLYVLGFAFGPSYGFSGGQEDSVVLIRKNKPKWQAGRLNGVGGHVERNELNTDAMVREFLEETGIETRWQQWQQYATLESSDYACYVFRAFDVPVFAARSVTDEQVELHPQQDLPPDILPSVRYLIPMALDPTLMSPHLSYR